MTRMGPTVDNWLFSPLAFLDLLWEHGQQDLRRKG